MCPVYTNDWYRHNLQTGMNTLNKIKMQRCSDNCDCSVSQHLWSCLLTLAQKQSLSLKVPVKHSQFYVLPHTCLAVIKGVSWPSPLKGISTESTHHPRCRSTMEAIRSPPSLYTAIIQRGFWKVVGHRPAQTNSVWSSADVSCLCPAKCLQGT